MLDEEQRDTRRDPDGATRPHPVASEVTDQRLDKSSAERQEDRRADIETPGMTPVARSERKAGRFLLIYGLLVLALALIVAAIFFGPWNLPLFILGLAILFAYIAMISAPFWLASSTKRAQDEEAKDVVEQRPERIERDPELRGSERRGHTRNGPPVSHRH